jgi:hypothetical protein
MCFRWEFEQQTACVPMMMVSRMVEQDWVQLPRSLDRNKNGEKRIEGEAIKENKTKKAPKIHQRTPKTGVERRLKFKCEYTIKIT